MLICYILSTCKALRIWEVGYTLTKIGILSAWQKEHRYYRDLIQCVATLMSLESSSLLILVLMLQSIIQGGQHYKCKKWICCFKRIIFNTTPLFPLYRVMLVLSFSLKLDSPNLSEILVQIWHLFLMCNFVQAHSGFSTTLGEWSCPKLPTIFQFSLTRWTLVMVITICLPEPWLSSDVCSHRCIPIKDIAFWTCFLMRVAASGLKVLYSKSCFESQIENSVWANHLWQRHFWTWRWTF